jgi:hypothetical protein
LNGPYTPPPLRKGDRTHCLLRDCDVVITSWSNGRIPWPRCRALHSRGGSGILLDEELARAVRQESALAIGYWWGASEGAVCRWRKALGVTVMNNEASHELIVANAGLGADAIQEKEYTREERQARSEISRRLNVISHAQAGRHAEDGWTEAELALLGTATDSEVARRTGRTYEAVRLKRRKLKIPHRHDGRKNRGPRRKR